MIKLGGVASLTVPDEQEFEFLCFPPISISVSYFPHFDPPEKAIDMPLIKLSTSVKASKSSRQQIAEMSNRIQ